MSSKPLKVFSLSIFFLSPIIVSIIYWFQEPLDSSDPVNNIIHRTGSILGIISFIWMCFNIIINIKIKLIEKNFSLRGIMRFHTYMAAVSLIFGSVHYPMVRLEREYSSLQIRSGSFGYQIFFILMILALIFMSNLVLKYRFIKKLRLFAFKKKFKYTVNKILHNLMILGVLVIYVHTSFSFTSQNSSPIRFAYTFIISITIIGWIYHKLIRLFRSDPDPYKYRKAEWDNLISEITEDSNKFWALNILKENPSIYPCLQCGVCTEICPVSKITKGQYNPKKNILATLFGYKDLLLKAEELVIWGCTTCHTCDETCPQNIELTGTFISLKNQSIAQNKGPHYIYEQAKTIFENAKAIPMQPAIKRRRDELGLPEHISPDLNEVQTLLKNLEIDKKLKL
ncbi:MAG: 4Fe-4S dicluster domain-containing protein [Candidatus Thorarchaeota archaeon]